MIKCNIGQCDKEAVYFDHSQTIYRLFCVKHVNKEGDLYRLVPQKITETPNNPTRSNREAELAQAFRRIERLERHIEDLRVELEHVTETTEAHQVDLDTIRESSSVLLMIDKERREAEHG